MLTIRKQNFESQQCYCCTGGEVNICDPKNSVEYYLYHRLPNGSQHIPLRVIIPRCKVCASKMQPVLPISVLGGIIGGIGGFMYTFSTNGVFISLLCGLLWAVVVFFIMFTIISFAFRTVYSQDESNYDLVALLINEYGWQTDKPKDGDSDNGFTNRKIDEMLKDLVENYGCEYGDV